MKTSRFFTIVATATVFPPLAALAVRSPIHAVGLALLVVAWLVSRRFSWFASASTRAASGFAAGLHAGALVLGIDAVGPNGVHLAALQAEPGAFTLLHTIPFVGLVGFASGALFPPLVLVNLVVLGAGWIAVELLIGTLPPRWPTVEGEPESIDGREYYLEHDVLGYIVTPGVTARHRRVVGGEGVYDVLYQIDSLGRRVTPIPDATPPERFLVFLGDSNTFGEGLEQAETLPAAAASAFPRFRVYNYGLHGYGPAQALDLLEARDVSKEITERRGLAVFTFIPAHLGRVVGSSEVAPAWGGGFSRYVLDEDGDLLRKGSFVRGRPLGTLAQYFWNRSNVVRYFGLRLPLRYDAADYRLTARILAEVERRLKATFDEVEFFVIIAPVTDEAQVRAGARLGRALQREGVSVLDLSSLVDFNERRWRVADEDWHHSAELNRLIASTLVERLAQAP